MGNAIINRSPDGAINIEIESEDEHSAVWTGVIDLAKAVALADHTPPVKEETAETKSTTAELITDDTTPNNLETFGKQPEPTADTKLKAVSFIKTEMTYTITADELHDWAATRTLREHLHDGDKIAIPLKTGDSITAVCGNVRSCWAALITLDCLLEDRMSAYGDDAGYYNSIGRKCALKAQDEIAPEWAEIIMPRAMQETIDGKTVRYADKLWIPSATDVFGEPPKETKEHQGRFIDCTRWNDVGDNFQFDIFKTALGRIRGDAEGTVAWWTRSVYTGAYSNDYENDYCIVDSDGTFAYANKVDNSYGFVYGFYIC